MAHAEFRASDCASDCSESQLRQGLGSVGHASEVRQDSGVGMIRYGQYDPLDGGVPGKRSRIPSELLCRRLS